MSVIETIAKWLKDPKTGKILVPKTMTSCVFDENGKTVEDRLQEAGSGGGGDATIRYVESTDYIQVKINGEWKNYERAYMKTMKSDFRQIRLMVSAINKDSYVQFTELQFRNDAGKIFEFKNASATASGKNTAGDLTNGVDGNYNTKICIPFSTTSTWSYTVVNGYMIYMGEYPIFEIVNASDQSSYGRIPTSFKLEASADGTDWTTLIDETDATPLSTGNFEVAYRKDLTNILKAL